MTDKIPIEPSETYGGGFSFGKISFRMREMAIAIGLVVVVVLSLVFVALYSTAAKSGDAGGTNIGGKTAAQQMGTTPTPDPKICNEASCFEAAGYVRVLMNTSIDPCEDFYTYACGNWPNIFPLHPDYYSSSVTTNILRNNKKKLVGVLGTDVKRNMPWAAERKAKDLYTTCMDDYGRMAAGGNALIDKVLDKIGGWALAHGLPSDWNILNAIEKVHVDFWTTVLFRVYVGSDYSFGYRYRTPIITIQTGGLGMGYYTYYFRSYLNKTKMDYQNYMRNVATLLVRDAKVPDASANVDQFVSDVMKFETDLANVTMNLRSSYYYWWYYRRSRMTLAQLNNQTQSIVNWVSYMKYLFDKAPISESTIVQVPSGQYLMKVAQMISNIPADSRNRILNNYFVWQIALKYSQDMSYEYIHARKQYYIDRYGHREFQDPADYCYQQVRYNMGDALSHIFIADHFADENKKKVTDIASYVKQALIDGVDKMDFMDKATKDYAKKKLSYTVDLIGYPDWLMDSDAVDLIYYPLNISSSDYFQNALSINIYDKIDMNNRLLQINGENHLDWHGDTFNSYMYHHWSYNELIAPAGILQHPLYDFHLPHYLNFGAIGSMFANKYMDAIDRTGARYGYHGERLRDPVRTYRYKEWWSNSTKYTFMNATKCFGDFYVNKTAGSYTNRDGDVIEVPVRKSSAQWYANTAVQEVGAVKQAYYAYQAWQKKFSEKMAPVIELTNEQLFFIAYAQTKCYITRPRRIVSPYYTPYFPIPADLKLNGAVAMLDEFSNAFKCSVNSTLNPTDKCSAF